MTNRRTPSKAKATPMPKDQDTTMSTHGSSLPITAPITDNAIPSTDSSPTNTNTQGDTIMIDATNTAADIEATDTNTTETAETEAAKRGRKPLTHSDVMDRSNNPTPFDIMLGKFVTETYGVTMDDNAMRVLILSHHSGVRRFFTESAEYVAAKAEADAIADAAKAEAARIEREEIEAERAAAKAKFDAGMSDEMRAALAVLPTEAADTLLAGMMAMMTAPKAKRGRPAGSKNAPKSATPAPVTEAAAE